MFQVDFLPEKKEIRINLPEEVWNSIDTVTLTRLLQEELVVEKRKEIEGESDLISRKAVEKIIKEFFKTKVDEIPKREKFNKLCDLCDLYLELNADLHKEIEDIPVAYDVDKVLKQSKQPKQKIR